MAVKLHRCSTMWLKITPHPCWKVQKALDDAGIEYEVVKHPVPRSKRDDYVKLTGQRLFPAIELEDGTVIRRESKEMAQMIRSGQLPQRGAAASAAPPGAAGASEAPAAPGSTEESGARGSIEEPGAPGSPAGPVAPGSSEEPAAPGSSAASPVEQAEAPPPTDPGEPPPPAPPPPA